MGKRIGTKIDQETCRQYSYLPYFRDHGGLQARGLSLFNDIYTVQEVYYKRAIKMADHCRMKGFPRSV